MILRAFFILFISFSYLYTDNIEIFKEGEDLYNKVCNKSILDSLQKPKISREVIENNCQIGNKRAVKVIQFFLHNRDKQIKSKKVITPPTQTDKCRVCGMFVAKFPNWISTIEESSGHINYYDGVKDMVKYYLNPKRYKGSIVDIKEILVQDYYSLEPVDAKIAFYVIGSNIRGPMGSELIPFKNLNDADRFLKDHHGKKIVKFEEIDMDLISNLD